MVRELSTDALFKVAVGAFVVVITLDMTRRDNDRKVLAVKAQMQDLMGVFFECVRPSRDFDPSLLSRLLVGFDTSVIHMKWGRTG